MTQPLTQEVAERYGYTNRDFEWWVRDYVDSLELDKRRGDIKPIKQFKTKVGIGLFTEDMDRYIIEKRKYRYPSGHIILNPNYIYVLKTRRKQSMYYIPIEHPFRVGPAEESEGLGVYVRPYKKEGRRHTYTTMGYSPLNYTIVGVLKFPTQVEFINWPQENPLEVKE